MSAEGMGRRARSARGLAATGLMAAGLVAGLAAIEGIARLHRPDHDKRCDVSYLQHPGYYSYPSLSAFQCTDEQGVEVRSLTDEQGLRNPRGTLAQAEVILLGDSFVSAVMTPEDHTVAGRLRQAGIRIYNAGMDGCSTFQELELLRALLEHARPRTVVVAFYLGNDFRDNYFGRLSVSGSPTRSAPSLKARLLQGCQGSYVCEMLYTRLYLGWVRGQGREPMASYSLAEMASWRLSYGPQMETAVRRTEEALSALAQLSRQTGCSLRLIGIPSKAQVWGSFHEISGFADDPRSRAYARATIAAGYSCDRPDEVLGSLARAHGIAYESLLPTFRDRIARPLFGRIDVHWTSEGQGVAAEHLLDTLFGPPKPSAAGRP